MSRELLSSSALDSEAFKIYCYKVVPCAKKFGHDWSECPFAHEGEKATRRCPALYRYSSIVCPEIRQSKPCPRGDVCPYSHSIFEYWMHPARFRAQMCSFGSECNRRICFFAHQPHQLRVPSEPVLADALTSRAPYLQGRVSPESRYALYPEQVPGVIGLAPMLQPQQQPQLMALQPDLSGQLSPFVYMPLGPGQPGMALAPGPSGASLQQQLAGGGMVASLAPWAAPGGGKLLYLPAAGQPSPGGPAAGMGYYLPAAGGGAGSSGGVQLQPSSGAGPGGYGGGGPGAYGGGPGAYGGGGQVLMPGGALALAGQGGGGGYGGGAPPQQQQQQQQRQRQQQPQSQQPGMQLVVAPDGSLAQAYGASSSYATPGASPAAPHWQPGQQPGSAGQLAGVAAGAGSGGVAPAAAAVVGSAPADTYLLAPGAAAEGGPYMAALPGGPAGQSPGPRGAAAAATAAGLAALQPREGGGAGGPGVDELAQHMAGWRIQ